MDIMVKKKIEKKIKRKTQTKAQNKSGRKIRNSLVLILVLLIVILILSDLVLLRNVTARQIDDVSPAIACEEELLEKSEFLMVIPLYNNVSIASNMTWCNYILSLNKTLAMHGVYHNYKEFLELRNESYIQKGIEEFEKCFGYYPEVFEAPQLALSKENKALLKEMNFSIKSWPNMVIRKAYHCQDTGVFAMTFGKIKITNKLMDYI